MELLVLNKIFDTVAIIDVFESFNWTDRYNEAGDFELTILATTQLMQIIQTDYYLYFQKSEHLMIIEDIEIITDVEDGDHIKITGSSLESILNRRIILNQTTFKANSYFQSAILKILNDSLGLNAPEWRAIPNFIVSSSTNYTIASMRMDSGAQYTGDNVYETIVELCKLKKVGFRVLLNAQNKFVFSLYIGTDHTASGGSTIPVIFSPYFENITNTTYYKSIKSLKTINYVAGEGEGNNRTRVAVTRGGNKYTGLARREMYTDARDISKEDEDGNAISNANYEKLLKQRGREKIVKDENSTAETFDGEVDYQTAFVYGVDYKLGDLVEVADKYGHETPARISEILFSFDEEGFSITPSFTVPDEEEID